jgi:hypothetical protein
MCFNLDLDLYRVDETVAVGEMRCERRARGEEWWLVGSRLFVA